MYARRRTRREMSDTSRNLFAASRPPDVASVRAKSTRHGKVTADRWNQ
jgi:hypothetical protein